ncbi:glycine zipper 2TM domain-containing protein [Sphingomonas canadensis]|uniref:17 kDa surface antigen n=1 Tax=Sphingomonas canadensis TaxID=1219257 RepID=A0ABW3HAJ0_9SPHN|nr:glycine zipper 2TM domain-containing protein [Sphingomonas canadensis]MCW3837929.1 glycine zipper 2TM domain-containing protein [Sphingomonas canadensis]
MKLRKITIAAAMALAPAAIALASPASAQTGGWRPGPPPAGPSGQDEEARFQAAQQRFAAELQAFQQAFDRYQQWRARRPAWQDSRWDQDYRNEGDWDPGRYYRTGPQYRERVLRSDERVYRGRDGRYYCKRDDGTTGLIVGAVAGGLLGNAIDGGHSRSVGTLLGALVGGLAGQAIDRNQQEIRCR